ncbi:MAG: hypothetical protein ACTSW1_13020 [Candidatus Hodarchaeales archaeon]
MKGQTIIALIFMNSLLLMSGANMELATASANEPLYTYEKNWSLEVIQENYTDIHDILISASKPRRYYALFESKGSAPAANSDAIIRSYDSNGELLWEKNFSTENDDILYSMIEDSDKNIVMVGTAPSEDYEENLNDLWLVKINPEGEVLYDKKISMTGNGIEIGSRIVSGTKDNFFISGHQILPDLTTKEILLGIAQNGTPYVAKVFPVQDQEWSTGLFSSEYGKIVTFGRKNNYYSYYYVFEERSNTPIGDLELTLNVTSQGDVSEYITYNSLFKNEDKYLMMGNKIENNKTYLYVGELNERYGVFMRHIAFFNDMIVKYVEFNAIIDRYTILTNHTLVVLNDHFYQEYSIASVPEMAAKILKTEGTDYFVAGSQGSNMTLISYTITTKVNFNLIYVPISIALVATLVIIFIVKSTQSNKTKV